MKRSSNLFLLNFKNKLSSEGGEMNKFAIKQRQQNVLENGVHRAVLLTFLFVICNVR